MLRASDKLLDVGRRRVELLVPQHVEHRHLTRSKENLRLAHLPSLQAGVVEDLLDDLALLARLEQRVFVRREQTEPV